MLTERQKKVLLLSVGYGEGHNAAAKAAAAEFARRNWEVSLADICAESSPRLYRLSQRFYHFCVRRAPWLWGICFKLADRVDWHQAVSRLPLKKAMERLATFIQTTRPDIIVCTYPLYAFMVDGLREKGGMHLPPCVVVVTDSLEISRPWVCSRAHLIVLPDADSASMVQQRYALPKSRVAAACFPVRSSFRQVRCRPTPTPENLRLVYGAFAPLSRVEADVKRLLSHYPHAHITLLAGERAPRLRLRLTEYIHAGALVVLERTDDMPELFARSHLYIGKAGAATMYEAYSAELPCIVNYALPGQEQGNLRLLLRDGAGLFVESTEELCQAVTEMMAQRAAGWSAWVSAMHHAARTHGAEQLVDLIEKISQHDGNDESHPLGG